MRIITHTILAISDLVFSLISYSEKLATQNGCFKLTNNGPMDDLEFRKILTQIQISSFFGNLTDLEHLYLHSHMLITYIRWVIATLFRVSTYCLIFQFLPLYFLIAGSLTYVKFLGLVDSLCFIKLINIVIIYSVCLW